MLDQFARKRERGCSGSRERNDYAEAVLRVDGGDIFERYIAAARFEVAEESARKHGVLDDGVGTDLQRRLRAGDAAVGDHAARAGTNDRGGVVGAAVSIDVRIENGSVDDDVIYFRARKCDHAVLGGEPRARVDGESVAVNGTAPGGMRAARKRDIAEQDVDARSVDLAVSRDVFAVDDFKIHIERAAGFGYRDLDGAFAAEFERSLRPVGGIASINAGNRGIGRRDRLDRDVDFGRIGRVVNGAEQRAELDRVGVAYAEQILARVGEPVRSEESRRVGERIHIAEQDVTEQINGVVGIENAVAVEIRDALDRIHIAEQYVPEQIDGVVGIDFAALVDVA